MTGSHLPASDPIPADPVTVPIGEGRTTADRTILRLDHLTSEAGWLLIAVGVIGVIVPGIIGVPFLLAGAFVIIPGGPELLVRWSGSPSPRLVRAVLRQVGRFLDDLERRYPSAH